jgi:allantoin racemase
MRIQIVNPNTTLSMTAKIGAAARAAASAGTEIVAVQPEEGPVSIEGYFDEALSVPGLLEVIARGKDAGFAGHVIACFDDTGLDAARSLASAPVVGIGEAAYHMAALVAGRFSVVTTLSRSIPALEHNLHRYGLASRCARVRAAEVPVLALEDPHSQARRKVSAEIDRSVREDRAEAIVLGCAGMADLARSLSAEHGLPVIEGVSAAIRLTESLAALGLSTSRIGGWATPRRKPLSGRYAIFS